MKTTSDLTKKFTELGNYVEYVLDQQVERVVLTAITITGLEIRVDWRAPDVTGSFYDTLPSQKQDS